MASLNLPIAILAYVAMIIVHEVGHWITARAFKLKVRFKFDGIDPCIYFPVTSDSPSGWQCCLIALSGPIAGLGSTWFMYLLRDSQSMAICSALATLSNLCLLLPFSGSDGEKITRCLRDPDGQRQRYTLSPRQHLTVRLLYILTMASATICLTLQVLTIKL